MNCFYFCKFVTLLQSFLFLETLGEKTHNSLVITIKDNKLEPIKPLFYFDDYENMEFIISDDEKTFHFCPLSDVVQTTVGNEHLKNVLIPVQLIESKEVVHDTGHCHSSNEPYLLKVKNPKELKKNWNDDNGIELYHSAYMVRIKENKDDLGLDEEMLDLKSKPEYESWASNYISILGIEFFYKTNIQQTVAVAYKLFGVIPKRRWLSSPLSDYKPVHPPLSNPILLMYLDWDSDRKFLAQKLGQETETFLKFRKSGFLTNSAFAPNAHFAVPLWMKPSLVRLNLFLMWHNSDLNWIQAERFAERVASSIGNLKVTAGVTGIMNMVIPKHEEENYSNSVEISPKHKKRKYEDVSILFENKINNFRLPKYVWKAFEYDEYGILVVMNFNPFIPSSDKICETDVSDINGWTVSNNDFSTGEIYSCNMTSENLRKLEADFVSLTEKNPFVLKYDSEFDMFHV